MIKVNTQEFRRDALRFQKTGKYTNAIPGTRDYKEYWDEQLKRCTEGYSVGGMHITGDHYGYLNFAQIKLTSESEEKVAKRKSSASKIITFPDFWDGDYEYFNAVKKARDAGKHMLVCKARRKGYSYKNGFIVANRYNTVPNSVSLIGAYDKKYLFPDGTMTMSSEYLNFFNEHTAWRKRRLVDKSDYIESGYKVTENGIVVKKGYKSKILALSFGDNPGSARGKDATLVLFEEGGRFPNLKESYMSTKPTLEDGIYTTGMIIVFGTGGGGSVNWEDFEEMFYDPDLYNLLSFENIWDEGAGGTYCSFYVPDYKNKPGFIDEYGNSDEAGARAYEEQLREEKKKSKNPNALTMHVAEYSFTPREAFLRSGSNIFPIVELNKHLGMLETTKKYRDAQYIGELVTDEIAPYGIKWKPNDSLVPITKFPLYKSDDSEGCLVIYEHPIYEADGTIPFGRYISGFDPYDQDESDTTSLGSVFIYKTFSKDLSGRVLVAEYTGRAETSNEFYKNTRNLLTYYNCKTLYENMLKGFKIYMEQTNNLHLLKQQPKILKDIVESSTVRRGYGIHMSTPIKAQCELYVRDWLLEKRADLEGDKEILGLQTILSIPLLKELIAYTRDGNFDRVIAFMLTLLHEQENYKVMVENTNEVKREDLRKKLLDKKYFKRTRHPSFIIQ